MITQTRETYERRISTLRRLGAEIVEITCHACGEMFVDPKPLGGQAWSLVVADERGRPSNKKPFCSESCATAGLNKHRGSAAAWVEGYEPSEPRNR